MLCKAKSWGVMGETSIMVEIHEKQLSCCVRECTRSSSEGGVFRGGNIDVGMPPTTCQG